jgi:hypothetical protein
MDAKTEAYLTRLVEQAPPLSEHQQDVIAACFRDAFEKPASRAGAASA